MSVSDSLCRLFRRGLEICSLISIWLLSILKITFEFKHLLLLDFCDCEVLLMRFLRDVRRGRRRSISFAIL